MSLEQLEERSVPNVAPFFYAGGSNNPTLQDFNVQQSGRLLTTPTVQGVATAQGVGQLNFVSEPGNPDVFLLGASGVNTFTHGGTAFSTFPGSAVNTLGQGPVNTFGQSNPLVPTFAPDAFGFGSGTQPGAPWAPAAYNVGLANRQLSYPSIADQGFQAPPPWARNVVHLHLDDQGRPTPPADQYADNEDMPLPLGPAFAAERGEEAAPTAADVDDDAADEQGAFLTPANDRTPARTDTGRDETRAVQEGFNRASEGRLPQYLPGQDVGLRRGEPEVEQFLFGRTLGGRQQATKDGNRGVALLALGENPVLATLEGTSDQWSTVEERLTESPLLLGAVLGLVSLPLHSPGEDPLEAEEEPDRERDS